MIVYIIDLLITTYTFMILARIIGSWFPSFSRTKFMHFLSFYTDPYLNIFRRIIPPIGPLDISPLFAFMALQLFQWLITWLLT